MDHRTNERTELDLLANVTRNGTELGLFQVKDIGNGGMGLIDENGELCLYDFISIRLRPDGGKARQSPPLYALVVQNTGRCAGAMWAVGQLDMAYLLKGLVPVAA